MIHNGKDAKSTVGVIIEAKKPSSKSEMLTIENINKKALQELVLYFLRERITAKNLEVKHLVVTNTFEWFVFDATVFDKLFAQNKELVKEFIDFEEGRLSDTKTDFFYKNIAERYISKVEVPIDFAYFDIREFDKALRNTDKKDDNALIALFKLLSPEHLLKLPFSNDSNSLDKAFYSELLHIIGLTETKDGGKKIIDRKKENERNSGSLLENGIIQLDNLDKLSRLEAPSQFGENHEQRLFNIGLELSITWVNRILFLKLLEAQLIAYHKGDRSYAFLNHDRVKNYDDLNSLFFAVLAKRPQERNADVKQLFAKVPYLNSSLFEVSDIEDKTIVISNLRDEKTLPILSSTVLKDSNGKKRTGELNALHYFFEFLNAYDFSSEGSEEIQEENKTLINASVLGLIFEKINGYKDGSFFTPGFITMYMCRETIRRAVLQKFKENKGWDCETIEQLYDKIENRKEANDIINSIKICDPAVGSGHFLVSALNEIIAIKSELKVLLDREGKRLKEYVVEVVNDELIVTDEDGELFEYVHTKKESQRIQETMFHEKQTIIENCLFGVDINPNSVKICRLRLWIELLKNAYYKASDELETLPNIDINIKCGNSLISRFALDSDLKQALKKSKWNIESYKLAVSTYREAKNKEEKRGMEALINEIKGNFRTEISKTDPKIGKLYKLKGELMALTTQTALFGMSDKEKKAFEKNVEVKTKEVDKIELEIEEIKSNKIYENAFEWRFEFPEVLNDEGDFVGFDIVIGNPPYGVIINKSEDSFYRQSYEVSNYQIDTYVLFIELAVNIGQIKSSVSYIIPCTWYASTYDIKLRTYLIKNLFLNSITTCPKNTFEDAVVETSIISLSKNDIKDKIVIFELDKNVLNELSYISISNSTTYSLNIYSSKTETEFINRLEKNNSKLGEKFEVIWGIKVYEKGKGNPPQKSEQSQNRSFHSTQKLSETYLPIVGGSEVFPYKIAWKGGYVNYGPWIAAPRSKDWFDKSERVVVREITAKGKIFAAYSNTEMVFSNSTDVIRSKSNFSNELKVLLGILNSKLASFYHLNKSGNSQKESFPKVLLQDLRNLPIPENLQKINLLNKINHLLESDFELIDSRFKSFEKEIDQLVYELYELTEDEIKIVEGTI